MRSAGVLIAVLFAVLLPRAAAGEVDPSGSGRLRKVADPADALLSKALSEADTKRLAELFARLASENFDEREEAQKASIAFGERAIPMAKKFEASDDAEVRHFARRFQQILMLRYHGYMPVAPELKAALAAPRRVFIGKQESFRSALERLLRDGELTAAFAWKNWPDRIVGTADTVELNLPTGEALQALLQLAGMSAVPRGAGIAIVPVTQASEMSLMQEHLFAAESLATAERERLAAELAAWLPTGAAAHASGAGIRVTGREEDLRLAARGIFGGAPDALDLRQTALSGIYPTAPDRAGVAALFDALASPVEEFKMEGIEPLRGIARLRAAGHPVVVDDSAPALVPSQPAVSLNLHGMPLGLVLRWLDARANQAPPKDAPVPSGLELQPLLPARSDNLPAKAQVIARLIAFGKQAPVSETAGFADIAFLYSEALAAKAPPDADAAVCSDLRAYFDAELSTFPRQARDFALFVFKRKLIVRGPAPLVARAVELIDMWRTSNRAPVAKWREGFARRIQREIAWDGSTVTAQSLLQKLREATGINILLERELPLGTDFQIDAKDAELFPRGARSAKELILRLCEVSKAALSVRWGAVVLSPVGDPSSKWREENDAQMIRALQGFELKTAE